MPSAAQNSATYIRSILDETRSSAVALAEQPQLRAMKTRVPIRAQLLALLLAIALPLVANIYIGPGGVLKDSSRLADEAKERGAALEQQMDTYRHSVLRSRPTESASGLALAHAKEKTNVGLF